MPRKCESCQKWVYYDATSPDNIGILNPSFWACADRAYPDTILCNYEPQTLAAMVERTSDNGTTKS